MITLLQLDYFRKLAANEHITQTAKELHISQTALSSMIIGLEKELGTQLFDRTRRTIRINEAGKLYLKYVNDVFAALDNGHSALQDLISEKERHISLAVGSSLVWMPMIQRFHQENPSLILKQRNINAEGLNRALQDMEVDFVIAGDTDIYTDGIEKTWLKDDDIYLCVSPSHPLASRQGIYMAELENEAFINLASGFPWRDYCDRLFDRVGFTAHTVVECDYTMRGPLIESGFGVALTTTSAKDVDLLKPNVYIPILDAFAHRSMYIFWNSRRFLSQTALLFRDFCVDFYTRPRE